MSITHPNSASAPMMRGAGGMMNLGRLRLQPPAARAHHLARLRGARRERQRRSPRSCCCSPPRTPSRTSTSTSTRPAARSPPAWRSTTPCSSSTRRRHRRHGPGRLDGPVPAHRRHQGQALRHAARPDHDAPAVGRHRRHGVRHHDPGRADPRHQEASSPSSPPQHTGQTVEQIDEGLRPRPLVHRRGGPGVRLRRPRRARSADQVDRRRRHPTADSESNSTGVSDETPPCSGTCRDALGPQSRYILPQFEERTPTASSANPYTKLFEDRIIFLGVQVDDASADDVMAQLLVLESRTRPRHHRCTSTRPVARSPR